MTGGVPSPDRWRPRHGAKATEPLPLLITRPGHPGVFHARHWGAPNRAGTVRRPPVALQWLPGALWSRWWH